MTSLTRRVLPLLLVAAVAAPASAQSKPADTETVVTLVVSPAKPPDPAFRYTFIPQVAEQTPGNAATLYLNAFDILGHKVAFQDKERELRDVVSELVDRPLGDLKSDEIAPMVEQSGAVDLLTRASRREDAGWDNTIREQGFEALLPYLNHARSAANFVALRARVQLARNDVPAAIKTSQLLFGLSNHLRDEAVLVQALVGAAITNMGLEKVVREIVQSPGAPNLYWALASLPRPMFSMRDAMAWEKVAIRSSLTPLRGRSPEDLSPGEWDQVARDFSRMLTTFGRGNRPSATDQIEQTALAVVYFPKAKQQLTALGIPADTVNAMPPTQVLGRAMLHTFDHWSDEFAKWSVLPYEQAAPLVARAARDFETARTREPLNPAYFIIPSVERAYITLVLVDRHIAVLQTVEALRAHAASHDGRFPATLADLTDLPAPADPTTGKPFGYKLTSETSCELSSPIPPGDKRRSNALRYIVKLRK